MTTVNVHEPKTQWFRLLARMAGAEEIVIACAGKPVVRLLPVHGTGTRRTRLCRAGSTPIISIRSTGF